MCVLKVAIVNIIGREGGSAATNLVSENLSLRKNGFFCTSISAQAIGKHRPIRSNAFGNDYEAWK